MLGVLTHNILQFQIEKETTKARRMVARVRKEVEIHSRLKHPSILEVKQSKIFDACSELILVAYQYPAV